MTDVALAALRWPEAEVVFDTGERRPMLAAPAEATLNPDGFEPDWDDWIEAMAINQHRAVQRARELPRWRQIRALLEEELGLDDAENEEQRELTEEEIESSERTQAPLLLAAIVRRRLIPSLARAWDDEHRLFQSLWACCGTPDWDWDDDDEDDAEEVTAAEHDPQIMWSIDAPLGPREAEAINLRAERAFSAPLSIGDEDTAARLGALEWVTGGCRITLAGSPAFLG